MKKNHRLILCCVLIAATLAGILCIALTSGKGKTPASEVQEAGADPAELIIERPQLDPVTPADNDEDVTDLAAFTEVDSVLTLPSPSISAYTGNATTRGKAGQTASPIAGKTPSETGGIAISGGAEEEYDCGTPGHHCDGPETHAYVLNLELEGCPYCGEHNCPSFYATDEWGNTCYTPSQCPQYDVHKDPAVYCQTCGKLCGDGEHDTCVQFVTACHCPNCGLWVEAWTCHTCE